ncbi:hypothetical protein ACWFRJ_32220 [Streptomyces sp. NPDC055239]
MATTVELHSTEETRSPGPVMVAITSRPTAQFPVAITSRPIGDAEFRITKEIGTFSESLGCSCQADDDQPY